MTLADFDLKSITTKADGAEVVKDGLFDNVCIYISDGPDTKVANLLAGIWLSREVVSKEQMFKAIVCALFPQKGYMRRVASVSALLLASAIGCQQELEKIIKERWVSTSERDCNEVLLALSDTKDLSKWIPVISDLFDLNADNDVKAGLIKATNNIARSTNSIEARNLLSKLVDRMPGESSAYANPSNFQFIKKLAEPRRNE